ncbi:MAG: hypothetical protein JXR60_04075 [Bacteroidales bacterium]|nr:hypothetical protein [Bacteroidales bacterium]
MLRFFKSNSIGLVFILPLLVLLIWSDIFGVKEDNFVPLPYSMPAYALVMKVMPNLIVSGIVAMLLIIVQAFYLVYINVVYNFISQRTYLTSLLFVLISSAFLNLHYLHPAIIANIFVLFTIVEIFSSYRQPKVYKATFNAGFWVAVAGLFYINANFLILFVLISLLVLHTFNWREWTAALIGFSIPYAITLFLYYFFDKWTDLEHIIDAIVEFHSPKWHWPLAYYLYSGLLLALGIISILKLSSTYSNNKVSTRSYFTLFTTQLSLLTLVFIFVPFASIEVIVLMAVPLSYLMSNYYLSKGNNWIQQISFSILLVGFIFFYLEKFFNLGA